MKKWNVDQAPPQSGKIAVVTGANSGIGYETTLGLAKRGAEVIMACRSMDRAEKARAKIKETHPGAKLQIMQIDTSSLKSVNQFAREFQNKYSRLDILVNNAAIMMSPYEVTDDGFENQLATNYLGHFAITGLLLPLLNQAPAARVVTLSSLSYKRGKIRFDDFHFKNGYSRRKAYGQSKRACLVFAYELQRRLSAAGKTTISLAAHPGISKTNLDKYFPKLIRPLGTFILQKASKGALPVLYAAAAEDAQGGDYIGPDGFMETRGYPKKVDSDEQSKNKTVAERLWKASEEMTRVSYLPEK